MINFDLMKLSIQELEELLNYHNELYWKQNNPIISDATYDQIVRRLAQLDPDNPLITAIFTPEVSDGEKVRHAIPMLSLDKAYSLEEVIAWAKKHARSNDELLLVEPKYDGISANFDGKILSTRGNGEIGEDISNKLPMIELETVGYTGVLDRQARGELIIRDDDFINIYSHVRKKDGNYYKNSRNAVGGIVGLKDPSALIAQGAKLTLVDYTLISYQVKLKDLPQQWESLLEKLASLPYPQDGVVLKFADKAFRSSLGVTAHHPKGEIAYKFTNIRKNSVLLDVEWSFGKNCLTPVAILEPVDINGTTIKRASLHNVLNIETLGVMIGDNVVVERAGDVIPYISETTPGLNRKSCIITNCPACNFLLERKGPELVCSNSSCPGTNLQRIAAAVRNLGIERLGEPTLKKIIALKEIRHVADLFELTVADFMKLEGFAAKSAVNLYEEIQKARNVEDYKLLAAFNIPNIGPNIARLLLAKFSLEELLTATSQQLAEVEGIGPERANALCYELSSRRDDFYELLSCINVIRSSVSLDDDVKTVCFTGKMPEKRSYYAQLAQSVGLRPVDDVSSTLTYLVAMDPSAAGGKLKKAQKYGVTVLALDDFIENIVNKADKNVESNDDKVIDNLTISDASDVSKEQETSNNLEEVATEDAFFASEEDDLFNFATNVNDFSEENKDFENPEEDEQLTLF